MFGQNTITSSWANPQQNPPQQQGTGAFGQPTAFGSTAPGFGSSTGAFGQPQQQQPQANPMFGNLGASTSNTGGGGFGAFGGASNQASTSTNPLFGGAKPATGFGAFGGGGTFGSTGTGTFGQPNTGGTGGFGQTSNPTTGGAFGNTGNSIFGGNKGTTAFGSAPTNNAINPVTTGSSNPPYTVYQEKDANAPSVTLQYQSISCMPAYAGTSFEELRLQDYQQGRKTAATGSFGQPSGFGNTQTGGSIFGQPQNQQSTSIFGAPKAPAAFGTFGATNTNTTNPGTGAFGTGGAFGQPQQPQPQQTFGAFGQPQQPQQPQQASSIFGGNTGGGAFGNTGTTGLGTFGAPTGGAFGQNANQQQQPQAGSSIFGQQPAASTTAAFGSFGNTANKPSIFGQASQPAGQTQSLFSGGGSSIFGQQNQPQGQQQQPQQPSIFGNTGGTGLFGNTQQQQNPQQPAAGTSLFTNPQNTGTSTGNSLFGGGGGGSLFGNNNQQAQQQQTQQPTTTGFGNGGLFGNANKPAGTGGGLFASGFGQTQPANTQQPGLFSNSLNQPNNQQQSNLGGSLFAKAPGLGTSTSTGNGLFGTQFGGSMNSMNGSTSVPGAQGTLIASISQPISTNLPIFSMLPPGPRAVDLEQSTKKKPGFFVDVPTRSPVPRVQLGYTPASSKLRGFGSSTSSNALGSSMFSNSTALTMSRSQTPKNAIDAIFGTSSSPSLGSGQRKSVKKLILDKKVEPTELFIKSGGSPIRGKITFSPALSVAAREKEAAAAAASAVAVTAVLPSTQPAKSPTPTPQPHRTPKKFTASASGAQPDEDGDLQEGDYYVKPNLDTLKTAGFDQLSSFQDLVVGRVGYGEIHFLDPVDLTGLLKLGALLGEVIRFDDKECSVYPDSDDADKPPPGSGLNVRAKISLKRCWAIDKAHRDPIKDEKHPSAVKHLKKLKNMKDTHFESFDISDGTWTFTVDHF